VWNHAADYAASKSAPMTWMTSIVRNRCLDWLRRPHPESGGEEYDIAAEAWHDEGPGPLEQLVASVEANALARCMGQLESKQRQSIMLAFFHGLSHSELAAHMRQPLGTVKTWVRRGLERLRGCLNAA
jgi:RNA polymerase sigma-70 factor (ECF subfamily)